MANYIMRSNGTTYEEGKKKKKKTTTSNNTSTGNNYIMRNDGTTYLEQPTVSSQQSGQLAPVKSKKVATTVAPTRANVSENTINKYSGYTREQLIKEKSKIQQQMNAAAGGDLNGNGKTDLKELFAAFINGSFDKNNTDSKEYKKYKKQYQELNNYLANRTAQEYKVDAVDKIIEPFEYGAEKANEAINTTVQKARNSAPDWMKAEKHKITVKEPTVGDMIHEKVNDSYKTKLGKTYSDLTYTIGYMTPSMMMPGAGGSLAMTGITSFGGSYQDAINQGKTDQKATKYGLINATLEVGLEKALGGFSSIYGKSATSKLTDKLMSKLIGNKAVRDILGRAGSEFTEEYLQEFLDPIVRNAVLDEKNGADFWNEKNIGKAVKALSKQFFNKENLYAGTLGAISAGVLETPDVYQKSKYSKATGRDYNTGYTENEQTVIDKTIEKRLEEKENSEQITEKERKKIEKEVKEDLEAGKIPFNEVVEALGENRITPQDTYLVESYNDEQNKGKRYEYKGNIEELSEYGRAAVESAKVVANNTKSSQEFVDAMVKMSEDRQMAYKFTTTEELQKNGLVPEGKQANSLYVTNNNGNREVLVNINSGKYLESLLVHETTHDLESNKELYNALKDATENFAVAKGDYNNIRKEVMETYTDKDGHLMSNVDINSEVTARLLEDYLGNEEYISHLTNQKPNLVQKIIDTVKYLKKQFTAGSSEARRLNNLQYKMEQAYKKAYNNQSKLAPVKGNIKYSLIGEVGLKNLSKENNKAYISLNNRLRKAKSMNEKKVSNQEIWLETGWFLDKNNRWKYDLTDKPFSLKEVNIKENTSYKLGDLVEHKALFKLYPELKDITVRIKDYNNKSTNGSYSKNSNEINISNKLLNTQDIEGTLIHEIQHAIQKIEGFEGGSNTRLSRLKYYNSLGEIEASDTKERFINEKYNNYNLDNISPSSVDKNAKHKDLNNYLQNRRTFDKIKDKIFVKDGDGSVQKNQEMDSEKYNRQNRTLVDARIEGTSDSSFSNAKYSLTDNQGNKLSKEQQEYFKDSKVRDDNGKLKRYYNGGGDYTAFDNTKMSDQSKWGKGIYLTELKDIAKMYGDDVKEVYANVTTPINQEEKTISFEKYNNFMKTVYGEEAYLEEYDMYDNDLDLLWDATNKGNWADYGKELKDILGIDGLIINDESPSENMVVAFNSNQIKRIDNTNPTINDDIDYSLSNNKEELPYDRNKTRGEDVRYSEQIKQTIEPLRQEIQQLTQTINEIRTQPQQGNTIAEEKTNNDEVLTIRPDRKQYSINKRVQKAIENSSYKGIKEATAEADKYIKFTTQERRTFKDALSKYAGMTKEDFTNVNNYREIEAIVENFANREYNYVDTELKSMKDQVRKTQIKVSDDLKNRITDYNDFRKSNFGKLKLGNEGQYIDDVWAELSGTHPEYFSENITNEEDMLYALSDFMNEDINLTEQFRLSDEDIEIVRDKVFNTLAHNQLRESDINELQTELDKVVERKKRTVVQENLLHEMNITREDIQKGNDISAPAYQRTDPVRLHEKVFGYETGKKINDATVYQVKHNEAERTRFLNKERNEIKALGIKPRSKESAAVQKYAEKEYINEKGEYSKYGDRELAKEFTSVMKQNKIKKAAAVLRAKYDTYIDSVNGVLVDMGYDAIPKRDNYMKHFYELTDKFSQWGVPFNRNDMRAEDLPTDINGITDEFKPGKSWFASAMERKGMSTVYDAITGIDTYIDGASNLIYHTEDIQRYRTLSKFIREEYGQQHGLDNIENMSEEEIEERLSDIQDHKLSKYVAWLDEQANALAGKKGKIDRAAERLLGRKAYTALNTLKQQVGSNMTGFNVRSAMTNFASAIQGASKTNKLGFIQGTISTVKNIIHKDNLIDKSDFLTNRFGSDTISKKTWQKAINAGQIFMTGTDYFTANQIWRGKYYENLNKGMSEKDAIKNADDFASRIMGDRTKGQTAEIFNSKTLGLLTQFQLEVNNQWSSLIHDNKMDIQSGNKSGAMVVFQLGQLFGLSYLFNSFMKSVTGSKVMIDPIDLLKKIFGADDDDKEKTLEQRAEEALGSLVDDIPFASVFTGGRIPIGEAFTGVETLAKKMTNQTDKYGNKYTWGNVKDDAIESAFYLLLPTGYGQAKKAVKGMSMYSKKHPVAGSYTDSGNLRFEADTSGWGKTKAFLFGQYASKSAQDYINRDYSSVDKDKLKEMKKIGLSADEYTKLKTEITQATKTQDDKKNYKYYDENGKLYYYNKDKDIVYDSKYKKTSIDISELDKAKRKELLEKFLKSKKGLTSKQKEYLLENTFKGGKK
nr:MAG TPA: Large polyvalent protein associated domain 23 [Bacteriophage sp.]